MRTVDAVIIAKGGSVRIPRKNLADVAGKPLVAWSILQCLAAEQITRVWVSTDDDEIQHVSESYGATVIRRPEWMNNSHTGGVPYIHALMELREKYEMDLATIVMPTSPLRLPGDLDRMIDAYNAMPAELSNKGATFAIPRADIHMEQDLGNGMHGGKVIRDKRGRYIEIIGSTWLQSVDDAIKWDKIYNEYWGFEWPTDKIIDGMVQDEFSDDLYPLQHRAWAPLKWWQGLNIDYQYQLDNVRDAWKAFMPKETT